MHIVIARHDMYKRAIGLRESQSITGAIEMCQLLWERNLGGFGDFTKVEAATYSQASSDFTAWGLLSSGSYM